MSKITRVIILSILVALSVSLVGCASTTTSESTGQYIDSSAITAKVKTDLVKALGVKSVTGIEVSTYKGVVQLSGFVNNQEDITKAVNVVKKVSGVTAVENSLLVKSQLNNQSQPS